MKIILTENQIIKLSEEIKASEAYRELDSIMTVIDGKRGVGFDSIGNNELFLKLLRKHNIEYIKCPSNPNNVVFFQPEYHKHGKELVRLAEKYGGYLAWNASEDDTRRFGELLEYSKDDIDHFIEHRWKPANKKHNSE